ncbi:uncharacterized protein LOC128952699 [Oppia nitens]|uniref:uncharacterized protein LOC128952699 n=1 Tax=Oppia nitens TaxID=1686743 RepID=UPI0023DBDF4D|nr:uncharacterized protein LOC128952699 [Oppia nitens]
MIDAAGAGRSGSDSASSGGRRDYGSFGSKGAAAARSGGTGGKVAGSVAFSGSGKCIEVNKPCNPSYIKQCCGDLTCKEITRTTGQCLN